MSDFGFRFPKETVERAKTMKQALFGVEYRGGTKANACRPIDSELGAKLFHFCILVCWKDVKPADAFRQAFEGAKPAKKTGQGCFRRKAS